MTGNASYLSISESEAIKSFEDAINKGVSRLLLVELLPTDVTIEGLVLRGLTDATARKLVSGLVKQGLCYEVRYKKANNATAKAWRAVVKK